MIAVVGHENLTPETLGLIENELVHSLQRLVPPAKEGLVRAGPGLPVAFGRAVRKACLPLTVALPTLDSVPAPLASEVHLAAETLLELAERVRLLEYDPGSRASCIAADEQLIVGCSRLFVVWDGSPSDGGDATAHLAAFAHSHGIPVETVWPDAARRCADDEHT